jgi:hypothetical protein
MSGAEGAPDVTSADEVHGPRFWIGAALGGLLMAWGVWLYLDVTPDFRRRFDFARWLVGADLIHDAVVAPALLLVGAGVSRVVPGGWRAPVQAALIATGGVLVVAWLPLHGTAEKTGNPTIQPLDYGSGTLSVLAVVWAAAAGWGIARTLTRRPPPKQTH